jgi:hypothetical protein
VILALSTDDTYSAVVLVGYHAVAVYLFLVNPSLVVERLGNKRRLHEGHDRWCHNSILPLGASGLVLLGRLDRMRDAGPAVARHPHSLTIYTAVQITAAAMLLDVEGDE